MRSLLSLAALVSTEGRTGMSGRFGTCMECSSVDILICELCAPTGYCADISVRRRILTDYGGFVKDWHES